MRTFFAILVAIAIVLAQSAVGATHVLKIETAEQFVELTSSMLPKPLLLRIALPWDDPANGAAFTEAAELTPSGIAIFAELVLDSVDKFVIADTMQIADFPTIRMLGSRVGRPPPTRGAFMSSRAVKLPAQFTGSHSRSSDISGFLLSNLPTRFADPVTNKPERSVGEIESDEDVTIFLTMRRPIAKKGVLIYVPEVPPSVVLAAPLALVHSLASQLGPRVAVMTTSAQDVASMFGLTKPWQGVAIEQPLLKKKVERTENDPFDFAPILGGKPLIASEIEQAITEAAELVPEAFADETLGKWRRDIESFVTDSPLRKVETNAQFMDDIGLSKQSFGVVFLLRESDEFFMKHHAVAVDVARFAQQLHQENVITGDRSTAALRRFEVVWIDAEMHPGVAAAMRPKAVPSVGFLLPLQASAELGSKTHGIKYFEDGDYWPAADKIIKYMMSDRLLDPSDSKEMVPLDPTSVEFASDTDPARFKKEKALKRKLLSPRNNVYLTLDLKDYTEDEPENDLLMRIASGKVEAETASSLKDKKLSIKSAKRKEQKKKEEKKKLQEELERKKREKAERIKAKQLKDQQEKEEKRRQLEAEKEEKRKNPEFAKKLAEERKAQKLAEEAAKRKKRQPMVRSDKAPRDPRVVMKQWQQETETMINTYVVTTAKDDGSGENTVEIISKLDIPAKRGIDTSAPPPKPPKTSKEAPPKAEKNEEEGQSKRKRKSSRAE